jgi:tetratricopeptide (TPR) repeat protein
MSEQNSPSVYQGIQGIFSSQEVRKVGTGTTTRKTIQKAYWQGVELADGTIEVQPLNSNYVPSGPKRIISKDDFLNNFAPEPEFYISTVFPKLKELNKTIARAERHRENKEYYSAEMEFSKALKVDEDNIRANFGLGITYLERGENTKAEDILTRIVKLDDAFGKEHKHLFNEFGINLRKNNMLDQSLTYYNRAMELASQDENLYYNIARVYLEKKKPSEALDHLFKGLSLNPEQDILLKCLDWMLHNNLVPDARKGEAEGTLQKARSLKAACPAGDMPPSAPADKPTF